MRKFGIALVGALIAALGIPLLAATPANADRTGIEWKYSDAGGGYYRDPVVTEETGGNCPDSEGYCYLTLIGTGSGLDVFEPMPDEQMFGCEDFPQYELEGWACDVAQFHGCFGLWSGNDEFVGTEGEGRPAYPHVTFRQFVDPEDEDAEFDPAGPWESLGEDGGFSCVPTPDEDWVDHEDIWEVNYEIFQQLGQPEIDFAPNNRTLIDLPTIVSTDYPTADDLAGGGAVFVSGGNPGEEPVTIEIPLVVPRPGNDFTGTITATAGFEWHFEEGGTEPGRGTPYEPGRLPRSNPGYYVTNTFTTTGTKTVELHLTWTGTVAVPGIGVDEPIQPVEMDAVSDTIEVREKRAVLTDG